MFNSYSKNPNALISYAIKTERIKFCGGTVSCIFSCIVITHIEKLEKSGDGRNNVIIYDGTQLISRRKWEFLVYDTKVHVSFTLDDNSTASLAIFLRPHSRLGCASRGGYLKAWLTSKLRLHDSIISDCFIKNGRITEWKFVMEI